MAHTHTAFWSVNGGNRFEGVRASTHNAALRETRRLFSGQGYRLDKTVSRVGHIELVGPMGRAVIDVVAL
ncbi:hypothetical protein SEA_HONK_55 [Microbacterium phage Honk]|uniref:Uncharacterized protein n=1 Tax=Microbacterium phage Honk TaxID=2836095 RepID=A0A8F3ING9_9CAUD|nr:hypothetical protein SEA_HONK_55 [Microbacterium phage Honk]